MYVEVGELDERISADYGWPIGIAAWSVDKDGKGDIEVHVVRTRDGKASRARHLISFYGGRSHTWIATRARTALRNQWRGMAGQPEGLPEFDMRATEHVPRTVQAGQADYTAALMSIAAETSSAKLRSCIHRMLKDAPA